MNKALVLFSGGLDSLIAVKLLQEQNIEVSILAISLPYFDIEQAKEQADKIELPLKIVDISQEHLKVLKEPKYGYGKNMNPCIDCHILMLQKAKEIMEKEGYDFVATGEVLGERPMSQNKQALKLIKEESGLNGYLLRPLSAKLLEPTVPETKGWVRRDHLLDIRGKSRKRQMELAEKFGLEEYPTPSGGCLLTDPQFGKRVEELLEKRPEASINDIKLLKHGRYFWEDVKGEGKSIDLRNLIIVGRNQEDNENILNLAQDNDILVELKNYPGPTTLIRGEYPERALKRGAELTKYYSTKTRDLQRVEIKYWKVAEEQPKAIYT